MLVLDHDECVPRNAGRKMGPRPAAAAAAAPPARVAVGITIDNTRRRSFCCRDPFTALLFSARTCHCHLKQHAHASTVAPILARSAPQVCSASSPRTRSHTHLHTPPCTPHPTHPTHTCTRTRTHLHLLPQLVLHFLHKHALTPHAHLPRRPRGVLARPCRQARMQAFTHHKDHDMHAMTSGLQQRPEGMKARRSPCT